MIYTYAADLRNLKDPKKNPELLTGFSEKTTNEILGIRNLNERIQTLGTLLLFKEALSRHNMCIEDFSFDTSTLLMTKNMSSIGHSVCQSDSQKIHVCFSIAKNILICSFGKEELGCNIQKTEDIPKTLSMQYFNRNERKYLEAFSEKDANREYYRIVTLKESYLNMSNESHQQSMKNYEVLIDEEVELYKNGHYEECWFDEYTIPGYRISVCAKENNFSDIAFINIS